MKYKTVYLSEKSENDILNSISSKYDFEIDDIIASENQILVKYKGSFQSKGEITSRLIEVVIHFPETLAAHLVAVWMFEKFEGLQFWKSDLSGTHATPKEFASELDEEDNSEDANT